MDKAQKAQEVIEFSVNSPDIPHLYANGFISALGNGDTLLILQQSGRPIATLNLSFTMAKTLVNKLGQIIKELEKDSGNTIMTTTDMDKIMAKRQKPKSKGDEK